MRTNRTAAALVALLLIMALVIGGCTKEPTEDPNYAGITGIDSTSTLYVKRIDVSGNSSQYSAINIKQAGTANALAIGTGTGAPAMTITGAGALTTSSGATITGDIEVTGELSVTGNTKFTGTLAATGATVLDTSLTVGGGYGSTGCTLSTAGVLQCNGAATTDGALTADSATLGGGYGSTGCTVSTAGVLQCNGAATVDGAAALDGGITVDTSNFTVHGTTGAVLTASSLTAASAAVGGGYGATGCSISDAGVLQCNGAATTDGALTADSGAFGGGYGSTGCTISTAGVLQCNGAATVDGLATLTGGFRASADGEMEANQLYFDLGHTAYIDAAAGNLDIAVPASSTVDIESGGLTVAGSSALNGGITVDTSNFTVNGTTGAVSTASSLAADSVTVGGGYGSTGCTISTAGALDCDGAITTAGNLGVTGDFTLTPRTDNNNLGAKNEIIGTPRIKYIGFAGGTNGTAGGKTLALDDDTPADEWTASSADITCSNDSLGYVRAGVNSLQYYPLATAVAGDGCHDGVAYAFTDDESVGMWVYPVAANLVAGDIWLQITDNPGGVISVTLPAVTADKWTWIELNISGVDPGYLDVITDLELALSFQGAARGEFVVYFDFMVKWDATEEDAIGLNILNDGQLGIVDLATGEGLTEWTDFFIHYETGNDFVVWISDQSGGLLAGLFAY